MSWPLVPLGSLCQFLNGGTPSKEVASYFEGVIPWITGADITSSVVTTARSLITEEAIKKSATNLVKAGTVLLVTRTSVGKVAVADVDLCFSQDITALIPDRNRLDAGYLVCFLRSKESHFKQFQRGATIQGITRDVVSDLKIPLPPLANQQRIASILDTADGLRHKRRDALAHLDRLLQSVFVEMFGDPVTNPKGWPVTTIGNLVTEANYGSSNKAGAEGGYPMLRMNNITYSGGWNFSDLKYIDLTQSEAQKFLVHKGEVLFNRTNSKELVGKTGVYRRNEPMAFAGYLIRLKMGANADGEYISAFLNSKYGKKILINMCKSIVGMANINAQELKAIAIAAPPLAEQQKFAAIVEQVESLRARQMAAQTESDALFAALQARAFAGEL